MDLKKVWENVLLETQGRFRAMTYDNWLSKTEAVCIADDELLVSAGQRRNRQCSGDEIHGVAQSVHKKRLLPK